MNNSSSNGSLKVKTRSQIAEEYGFSPRTLSRRLKKLNIKLPSGLLTPADILRIYQILGKPRP